ncbi:hypothetical protein D3C87_1298280 [compost metagenome]
MSGDNPASGKGAQLNHIFSDADQVLRGLQVLALGEFDNAFNHPVDQLIDHIPQHGLPKHRYEWGHDEQANFHDVGEHFFQVFNPGPACGAVRISSGHRQRTSVGKDLVHLSLIEINPGIVVLATGDIAFERHRGEPQVRALHLGFAPGG